MRVVKDTPIEIGWIVWPVRPPEQTLVLVAKATFALVPDGECALAEKQQPVTGDLFWDDDPERAVRYDSDLAIGKPRGEWWVTGTWRAPAGRRVTHHTITVRVGGRERRIALIGDRWWKKGFAGGITDPSPLTQLPLSPDRAFGGPGHEPNPYGVGMLPDPNDPDLRVRLPNIEDPARLIGAAGDRPPPAGLSPISRSHPRRMALTGTYDRAYMEQRWPYFPEDFAYEHFQAAPPEQRIDGFFRGDEVLSLDGLFPEHPSLRCRLPGIAPRAFLLPTVAEPGADLVPVGLVLDTLVIDVDAAAVLAVWRGHVAGVQESLEDASHVFLVHEPYERPQDPRGYRAWFDRKLAEEDADEQAFEAEPVPEVAAPPPQPVEPDAPPAEPPTPAELQQQRRDALLAEGLPLEVVNTLAPETPAPPPDPGEEASKRAAAIAAARELGRDDLAEAMEVEPEVEPEVETAPSEDEEPTPKEPTPHPQTLREVVERALAEGRSLAGAILSGADLSGLDFSGRDLSGCVLAGANLRGARFVSATLDSAVLDGAEVDDCLFRLASLREASLAQLSGERVSFRGALLEDARGDLVRLPGADFRELRGSRMELSESLLAGACFDGAVLDEADFSGSNLASARFVDASLVDAWLDQGAVATGACFEGADVRKLRASDGSDFTDATFKWAKADEARFGRSKLDRANFSFADLAGADFTEASLTEALLLAVQAPGARFQGAVLVKAQLGRANLLEARFESANLAYADLRGCNLFRAELYKARMDGALLELANLAGTKLEGR